MHTAVNSLAGVLVALTGAIGRTRTVDDIYSAALETLTEALGVTRSSILLFDSDGVMRFKAYRGLSREYRGAVEGHTPWTPETADPQPITVDDVAADPGLAPFLPVIRAEGIAAMAFVPLVSLGRVIGKFMLYYDAPHAFTADEIQVARVIASQVAFAIERTRAELEARRAAELNRSIIESSRDCIKVLDLEGNLLLMSQAGQELLRIPDLAPYLNRSWVELWEGEDRVAAHEAIRTAGAGGTGRFVGFFPTVTGEPKWWDVVVTPIRNEAGTVERLLAISRDITERRREQEALRESQDVLSLAMRGGRMGAWSRDLTSDAVWWSRELEQIFGLPPGGFEGTESGFYTFVHPEDRPAVAAAVGAAIATHEDYRVEFRFRHASGEWRWMEGRGRAVYGADGRPRMLYGLGIDITGRKAAEQSLAAARDAAETANQLKDQFLATLSHELRTPLNAILGYARMLRTDVIPPQKRARALEIIERNAVVQNQLVEDLLDISRITSGKVRLDLMPIPAASPLQEALESVRPAAHAKGIELDVSVDSFAGTVLADPNRLQQVFWNLLNNAVKFTPEGGRITATLEEDRGAIVATVADTGIGIPTEFLPWVFEPFRQADGRFSREHGGLGLGLAICRQLVELHGGSIQAASDGRGLGARFTVRLPLRASAETIARESEGLAAPSADDRHAALLEAGGFVAPDLRGCDVLVVDDEEDALDLFRQVLEHAGASVRTAADATRALAEFRLRPPDVVVSDLGLPGMDGFSLLKEIRARFDPGRLIPAVAVTAYARSEDRTRVLSAGFDAHVTKPVDPGALVAAIAEAKRL